MTPPPWHWRHSAASRWPAPGVAHRRRRSRRDLDAGQAADGFGLRIAAPAQWLYQRFQCQCRRCPGRSVTSSVAGRCPPALSTVMACWCCWSVAPGAAEDVACSRGRRRRERESRFNQRSKRFAWSSRAKAATTRSQLIGYAHMAPREAMGVSCLSVAEGAPPRHNSHGLARISMLVDSRRGAPRFGVLCSRPRRRTRSPHPRS